MTLLYRANGDDYNTLDFHAKCDKQSGTLTVIETTKGFIFGGYAQASWSSTAKYSSDSHAFLFSLVNKFKKPFLCRVRNASRAVCSYPLYGPSFGGTDLCLFDGKQPNRALICDYQPPADLIDLKGFYFCDTEEFEIKQIEVFKLD